MMNPFPPYKRAPHFKLIRAMWVLSVLSVAAFCVWLGFLSVGLEPIALAFAVFLVCQKEREDRVHGWAKIALTGGVILFFCRPFS